jgi:hypothetical protein
MQIRAGAVQRVLTERRVLPIGSGAVVMFRSSQAEAVFTARLWGLRCSALV